MENKSDIISYVFLTVLLVSCNLQKREASDLEEKLKYCEKELAFIVSDGDNSVKINLDTIDGSKTVCEFVKEYYGLNKGHASFAFSYTNNRDTFYIGGEGGESYISCVFRGLCDSTGNLLAFASSHSYSITSRFYVVSPGVFFDYHTVKTVMSKEIDFNLDYETKDKNKYAIQLLDEISIQGLCCLLSGTVNAYVSSLNKYSKEKYLMGLCSLDSIEYNVLLQNKKIDLLIEVYKPSPPPPPSRKGGDPI